MFFEKKIKLPFDVKARVLEVLEAEKALGTALNIVFTDDKLIRKINAQYRAKNRETDVITFESAGAGDIYISVDTARRNAAAYGARFHEEIARLIVHGVLHALGYDHMKARDAVKMARRAARHERLFLRAKRA